MADDVFRPLFAFTDIEQKVLAHYKLWIHTYLAARERDKSIPVNTIARPRSYLIKQTFSALPGQEQTPIVICVSNGFAEEPARRGRGQHDALFRLGIAVVCYGLNGSARLLCGHYQAALVGVALRHRSIEEGLITFHDFSDLRIEDIDDEVLGRSMCAVRLDLIYRVDNFAREFPVLPLLEPPVDPDDPQPDLPEVETVEVNVENYKVDEEFEEPPPPVTGEATPIEATTVLEATTTFVEEGVFDGDEETSPLTATTEIDEDDEFTEEGVSE